MPIAFPAILFLLSRSCEIDLKQITTKATVIPTKTRNRRKLNAVRKKQTTESILIANMSNILAHAHLVRDFVQQIIKYPPLNGIIELYVVDQVGSQVGCHF